MAYGIGSVIGDIDQKVDTYRNKPEALAQMYQQNPQLVDLLALQKLKAEKEAAMRDMQLKAQVPAATIKDQREQEVMGMMRNEVAQQLAPGLQAMAQQSQAAAPQGGGISALPAPNMQSVGMAGGGIVAFAKGDFVESPRGTVTQDSYRRLKEAERRAAEGKQTAEDMALLESAYGEMMAGQEASNVPYSASQILASAQDVRNMPSPAPRAMPSRAEGTPEQNLLSTDAYRGRIAAERRAAENAQNAASGRELDAAYAANEDEESFLRRIAGDDPTAANIIQSRTDAAGLPPQEAAPGRDGSVLADLAAYLARVPGAVRKDYDNSITKQVLGGIADKVGSSYGNAMRLQGEGNRALYNPEYAAYLRMMEPRKLTPEQAQLEEARRMGLIPEPNQARPARAAPTVVGPSILPRVDQAQSAPAAPTAPAEAGIATLPTSQPQRAPATPLATLPDSQLKALLNMSDAVKQAPPEVQNEYTQRLGELREEQESKLETLISFLQGAGGKTSFAATMAGGAAGMNAREQRVEDEIAATVDKIETLKLKEREFGLDERQAAAVEEANRIRRDLGYADIESREVEGAAERDLRAEIAREGRLSDERIAEMRNTSDAAQRTAISKDTITREENANLRGIYDRYSTAAQVLLEAANDPYAGEEARVQAAAQLEEFKTTLSSLETQLRKPLAASATGSGTVDPNDTVGEFYY
jgi:hypothetical protein